MLKNDVRRTERLVGRDQLLGVALLGVALLACRGGLSEDLESPQSRDVSFVFGHLNMEDAPTGVDVVTFERVSPRTETPFYDCRVDDGTFYAEYFPPGSYVLSSFSSNGGFMSQRTRYMAPRQDNPMRLVIGQPGAYYAGSWKYLEVETDLFEAAKYDIAPVGAPTPKQLIAKILPHAQGTSWHAYLVDYAKTLP